MSDRRYHPPSKLKALAALTMAVVGSIFFVRWLWWAIIVPLPIHDWKEGESGISSPSHPEVQLTKVASWDIKGRVLQSIPISDPLLPTIGSYPRAIISPVDLFLTYGTLTNDRYFRQIRPGHEFRTAFSHLEQNQEGKTVAQWIKQGPAAPGGFLHEHTIPANYVIFQKLRRLQHGDFIIIRGSIVDVMDGSNTYRTSTIKNDRECEFLYIREVEILQELQEVGTQ